MNLPTFLIAGAPRSGTTWLHAFLDRHPNVFMAKPVAPEPKFFLVDALFQRGLHYYAEQWFAGSDGFPVRGEKSTNYLESAVAAQRVAEKLPDVQLIFVLREPAARAVSNYHWSVYHGHENRDPETALMDPEAQCRPLPRELESARPFDYLRRGRYAELLTNWRKWFSVERFLLVRFCDLQLNPMGVMRKVCNFLGIPEMQVEPPSRAARNTVPILRRQVPRHVWAWLDAYYRQPNQQLAAEWGITFDGEVQ